MALRLPADWMQASDERILEWLDAEGTSTPNSINDEWPFDYHRNTIQRRLRLLSNAGLVERVGRGVYRINNTGRRFLAGQEDMTEVGKPKSD